MKFKAKTNKPYVPATKLGIYQEGGEVVSDDTMAGDPVAQIMEMANMALQGQDCDAAMQVCMALIEMAGGGAAGAPPAGPEAAPPVEGEGGAPLPAGI